MAEVYSRRVLLQPGCWLKPQWWPGADACDDDGHWPIRERFRTGTSVEDMAGV